jgi:DNA replication and repair protein RecF
VDAHVTSSSEGRAPASTHLHFRYEPPKRSLALDSVTQTGAADYLRVARVAWFSNDDMEIVRGAGSKRRRYLDFLGSQLDTVYLRHLRAYDRALRSRNALLKEGRRSREIEAFNPLLIEHGDQLSLLRREASIALAPLIEQAARDIGGGEEAVVTKYAPGHEGTLAEALATTREEELRLRQTVAGPHRDDLQIELNGMEAARFASEGQQRTLALALKLAQTRLIMARTTTTPILLIDDVFGELDPARRQNLLTHLPQACQRLVTTTHLDWLDPQLPHTLFQLADRRLQRS